MRRKSEKGAVQVAKCFNVTGLCIPEKHYMVDLTQRIQQIRQMIQNGDYFTINRARQYGKTTTLAALARELEGDYTVISLDFQALGSASFQNENTFSRAFALVFLREMKRQQPEHTLGIESFISELEETVKAMDEFPNAL